jgi:poly(beta-D-mannuronate) lyase
VIQALGVLRRRWALAFGLGLLALSLALWACLRPQPPGESSALRSPLSDLRPVAARAPRAFDCPALPPPVIDLKMPSKYRTDDAQRATIDPENAAGYEELSSPIYDFMNALSDASDAVVRSRGQQDDAAQCAIAGLRRWAEADAMLGDSNAIGDAVRKWELASAALVYLKLRGAVTIPAADRAAIEPWLRRLALRVRKVYTTDTRLTSRNNNHVYWAAWGVTAAGLALDDRGFVDWGIAVYRRALRQIQPDGTLPLEMARGARALQYHVFAVAPLVAIAETAEANGVALYSEHDSALLRLIDTTLSGLDDPTMFARRSGAPQVLESAVNSANLAWLEFYARRFADPRAERRLAELRPMRQRRLGGNLTLLLGAGSDS